MLAHIRKTKIGNNFQICSTEAKKKFNKSQIVEQTFYSANKFEIYIILNKNRR